MARLFSEFNDQGTEVLTESVDGVKQYFIEGNFMQADIPNRNGRSYPFNILNRETESYRKTFIETKRALGELGHPDGPTINADRVSHLITELRADGKNFVGKAKILDTPFGKIAKNFIDEGIGLGVSTRGLGSTKKRSDGIMEVQSDFRLGTVDIVHDPSGPSCFVNGIMENTEFYFDVASGNWRAQEFVEQVSNKLRSGKKKKLSEEQQLGIFRDFLKQLRG